MIFWFDAEILKKLVSSKKQLEKYILKTIHSIIEMLQNLIGYIVFRKN